MGGGRIASRDREGKNEARKKEKIKRTRKI